jgi:isoleucyl-tRNA synthetase
MADVSRKIRNTARFLLSNLYDFQPENHTVAYDDLPEVDRYLLQKLYQVCNDITTAFNEFQFFKFFQTIQNFCTVDLSNFYLDIAKDRLYISAPDAPRRRSCQTVLMYCLEAISKMIAPVMCHTAEDIWQHLPYTVAHKSVFQAGWVTVPEAWHQPDLATKWEALRTVRTEVNKVMEQARNAKLIGSSLEAKVYLQITDETLAATVASVDSELRYLLLASQVAVVAKFPMDGAAVEKAFTGKTDGLEIAVVPADGEKCARCWNYSTAVGESVEHPHICERCVEALAGNF